MADASISVNKKRGRPATGIGTMVGVRLQPDDLAALDAWIAQQEPKPTRPEAIRKLMAKALPTQNLRTQGK